MGIYLKMSSLQVVFKTYQRPVLSGGLLSFLRSLLTGKRPGLHFPHQIAPFVLALTFFLQICLHPRRLHSHHRVHLSDRHSGGHTQKVPQPHLLHPLFSKPLHGVALAGHGCGVSRHPTVHGGVEQRGCSAPWTCSREGKEGRVKQMQENWPWWLKGTDGWFLFSRGK